MCRTRTEVWAGGTSVWWTKPRRNVHIGAGPPQIGRFKCRNGNAVRTVVSLLRLMKQVWKVIVGASLMNTVRRVLRRLLRHCCILRSIEIRHDSWPSDGTLLLAEYSRLDAGSVDCKSSVLAIAVVSAADLTGQGRRIIPGVMCAECAAISVVPERGFSTLNWTELNWSLQFSKNELNWTEPPVQFSSVQFRVQFSSLKVQFSAFLLN